MLILLQELVLGKLYYRMGKTKQAYIILKNSKETGNCYLLAICCVKLGFYKEAELALLRSLFLEPKSVIDVDVPGGAQGFYLLGVISRKQHRKETAIEYFKRSLEVGSVRYHFCNRRMTCL
jgi:tetratricopeptide (TPR) repeat protein